MNLQTIKLYLTKLYKTGTAIPESTHELSKVLQITFEDARSFKDFAIQNGYLIRTHSSDQLALTMKGKNQIQQAADTISSKPTTASQTVVRRTSSTKPLSNTEKAHFETAYEELDDKQLVIYHLILANSLGIRGFNYLSFKLLHGVLKIEAYKITQVLKELETLHLIRLEGVDGRQLSLNHSYYLLSKLFPTYRGPNDSTFNAKLSQLFFNPKVDELEKLRQYEGRKVVTKPQPKETPVTKPLAHSASLKPATLPSEESQSCSDSVLSVGELRHHTTQVHSSMPEVDRAYWGAANYPAGTFNTNNLTSLTSAPMMGAQTSPSPYPARRNPLTILIDGDQQSLKNFMKEAQLERLRSGDSIYLFSASGAHSNLSLELVQRIEELKENVYFKRITSGICRPNTMDHLIVTRLTMLLTVDFNRDFIILSNDKGFAGAITMLNDTYNLRRGQIQLQTIAIL